MECNHCGGEIGTTDHFCGTCGSDLALVLRSEERVSETGCQQCGEPLGGNDAFCGHCGEAVSTQPVSDSQFPGTAIVLIYIMSCGAVPLSVLIPSSLFSLFIAVTIGVCGGFSIRKRAIQHSSRAFHCFSLFFAAGFIGLITPVVISYAIEPSLESFIQLPQWIAFISYAPESIISKFDYPYNLLALLI